MPERNWFEPETTNLDNANDRTVPTPRPRSKSTTTEQHYAAGMERIAQIAENNS